MLDLKEEAKFKELKDKCRELKVPAPPEIFIGLQVHDKNGVLVFDDKQRGHSWTRNFWNRMCSTCAQAGGDGSGLFGAGYMSAKGTAAQIASNVTYQWANSHFPSTNFLYSDGITVGTGDTAFSVNQYALAAVIASGNGAGQLAYQTMLAAAAPSYTAGTKTWKASAYRIFNNNSGGSITVKETGLFEANQAFQNSGSPPTWMVERSVLSPTVAVANGAQLTVTYEISMDFSAID